MLVCYVFVPTLQPECLASAGCLAFFVAFLVLCSLKQRIGVPLQVDPTFLFFLFNPDQMEKLPLT